MHETIVNQKLVDFDFPAEMNWTSYLFAIGSGKNMIFLVYVSASHDTTSKTPVIPASICPGIVHT